MYMRYTTNIRPRTMSRVVSDTLSQRGAGDALGLSRIQSRKARATEKISPHKNVEPVISLVTESRKVPTATELPITQSPSSCFDFRFVRNALME